MFPQIEHLSFTIKSGNIPASLLTPTSSNGKLALVLPGAAYSPKMPLLHYSIQTLSKKGFKVLTIDKLYADDQNWRSISNITDAYNVVGTDSVELFKEISRFFPSIHTILARSLGTYMVACGLAEKVLSPQQIVWQCPSLNIKWAVMGDCQIRSLGIIGTSDERYETAKSFLPKDRLVIEGADHGLEVDEPVRSIEILKQVIQGTENWVKA